MHLCTAQAKALTGESKSGGTALGLAQANFGPKYEQHVAQLQKSLEEAHKKLEGLQREVDEARCVWCVFLVCVCV